MNKYLIDVKSMNSAEGCLAIVLGGLIFSHLMRSWEIGKELAKLRARTRFTYNMSKLIDMDLDLIRMRLNRLEDKKEEQE